MVRSASDPDQVKAAAKEQVFRQEQEDADILALMNDAVGRRFVWRLLGQTNVFKSIFVTSSEIYYKAGQQDIGHWLQRQVDRVAPEQYITMQREAAKLDRERIEPLSTAEDRT